MQHITNARLALILGFAVCCCSATGQELAPAERVQVQTTWSIDAAKPGEEVVLAVSLEVAPGFHIGNAVDLIPEEHRGETLPTRVALTGPSSTPLRVEPGPASFPSHGVGALATQRSPHLEGTSIVFVPVRIPDAMAPGELPLTLEVTSQACNETFCFPPHTFKQAVTLKIVAREAPRAGCPAPALFARWSDRRAAQPASKEKGFDYKSKEPPIGPPWVRSLEVAQEMALQAGKPIFLYSTKTFCPHCVIVESEMLSAPELKPHYDKAVWLYVYRDFQGGPQDRQAQRMGDRFSLSSWPQLWLIDPRDLSTIGETGRTVESFVAAVDAVQLPATDNLAPVADTRASEQRVLEFEAAPSLESALALLDQDDVVAQLAAVRFLTEAQRFAELASRGELLLSVPNDSLRFAVLQAIAETRTRDFNGQVLELVRHPEPSRNFNVLRLHALRALTATAGPEALEAIAPHAEGTARNSVTRAAVEAMVAIAGRHPDSTPQVAKLLAGSFPQPEAGMERLVSAHARLVHQHLVRLSGRELPFPETYDARTRAALMNAWLK